MRCPGTCVAFFEVGEVWVAVSLSLLQLVRCGYG